MLPIRGAVRPPCSGAKRALAVLRTAKRTDGLLTLAYSPGAATNHGTPLLPFTFVFGQQLLCTPPFLSACEGANVAPTISEPVYGECIGTIIGEEQW
eukprot:6199681-Pleurochrysis_carterae.AAC.1